MRSPTFILVAEYDARVKLTHVDAYRLSGPDDLRALGSDEFMFAGGVTVIEWADRVSKALPADHLWVTCAHAGETRRTYRFGPHGGRWDEVVAQLCG